MRKLLHILLAISALLPTACMEWEYGTQEEFDLPSRGLFIVNEGTFQYGNGTLSYYDPESRAVENEIFRRANGYNLGNVVQSMTVRGDRGWIVVNNGHVVFAVDLATMQEKGRITGLTSPRYIHFVSDEKAYITQLWDNRITIVDPHRCEITGYIECPDMEMSTGSTEEIVAWGNYLYINCWSYQNKILRIDPATDRVVGVLEVGRQPKSLVVDCNGKLWSLTDGGVAGSPYGHEEPSLWRIDAERFEIEQRYRLTEPDRYGGGKLVIDGEGQHLYWIDGEGLWRMSIEETTLPTRPLIATERNQIFYGLTIDPETGDIYIADAIDYQQQGIVYRYSKEGRLLDDFYVGVTPGAFCWRSAQ